ncbi:MAG: deoxyribose-phosphate aldolase [Clostridia bacterium]|nr:deoxyribose-phosphate aldolase [Clostridia bacterium]
MDKQQILKKVDHTLLKQSATFEDIKLLCDDAIFYNTASVCIAPSFVKECKNYIKNRTKICTVIGFPNGYSTKNSKVFETDDALNNGADEIDMVINIGDLKSQNYKTILDEIKALKAVCGDKILKVIIETCLLTDSEKIKMCHIVSESGADYIKTSTGFSTSGATFNDVELFKNNISENLKIKAAGGISDFSDAEKFIALGADRLGTSRLVSLMKKSN